MISNEIRERVREALQGYVFEPTTDKVFAQAENEVNGIFRGLGMKCHTVCDASNNPPESIKENKLCLTVIMDSARIDFVVGPKNSNGERSSMSKIDPLKIPEKFRRFIGNNHNRMDENLVQKGGFVHFGEHIGEPLSDRLWEDLEFRLHATNVRVYAWDDCMWMDGPLPGAVIIMLNNDYRVADIQFAPYFSPAMMKELTG